MEQPSDKDEEEPRLTRKSPFTMNKRLCPRCLSPLQTGSELGGWLVPQDYYCTNCGYKGTVFVEKQAGEPGAEPQS